MKLTPELQTALNGFFARVRACKATKSQLVALKNVITTDLTNQLLALDEKASAVKNAVANRKQKKIDFEMRVIESWAKNRTQIKGFIVKFRGNSYESYIHRVDQNGFFCEEIKKSGELTGITSIRPFGSIWKIKVNDKWLDVYTIASGNKEML